LISPPLTSLEPDDSASWARSLAEFVRLERKYRLCVIDDHDPQTLPRPLSITMTPSPSLTQLRERLRSWEALERITAPTSPEATRRALDEQVLPFLDATGLAQVSAPLASDHCFLIDQRILAPWPQAHAAENSRLRTLSDAYRSLIQAARSPT
jgi:hypothetical protein